MAGLGLLLSACWDFRDLDQRAFVVMLGVDEAEDDGYRVTAQVAVGTPHGDAQRVPSYRTLAGQGATLQQALQEIRGSQYRELDLSLLGTVIVGPGMARRGLGRVAALAQTLQLPASALMTVSAEPAETVINAGSPEVAVPGTYPERGLSGAFTRHPAVFPVMAWKLFYRLGPSPLEDEYLPALTSRREGINFAGAGLFSGGKLVGWLDVEEAELFGVLRHGRVGGHLIAAQLPGPAAARAALRVRHGRVVRWADLRDGRPAAGVRLEMNGALDEFPGMRELRPADIREIERALAAAERQRIRELLLKLQELGTDPLGFGELLRRRHPDHPLVGAADRWRAAWSEGAVRLEVQVRLTLQMPGKTAPWQFGGG